MTIHTGDKVIKGFIQMKINETPNIKRMKK